MTAQVGGSVAAQVAGSVAAQGAGPAAAPLATATGAPALRVLHVAAEVAPYATTGGLGVVLGELPAAQRRQGLAATVLTPLYGFIDRAALRQDETPRRVRLGQRTVEYTLWSALDGTVRFVDAPGLLDRPHPYGLAGAPYADNPLRFAVLCKVAASLAAEVDVYHLHDWQAALTALYLRGSRPTVQSVHNLAYQGLCELGGGAVGWVEALEIPPALRSWDGVEYYGQLSLLKAGLVLADQLATVSPTYAREIQEEPGGRGLAGLFRHRQNGLLGILNGLDVKSWDPATDPALPAAYDADDVAGKAVCQAELRHTFGLAEGPVFGVVSRAATQKGLDLLAAAAPALVAQGARFVVLADGAPEVLAPLRALAAAEPTAFGLVEVYEPRLARRIYAGSDFVVVPSRFEPCGLSQLIGMRYGAVPVVRHTGGLADTVHEGRSGLVFGPATAEALAEALGRALRLWRDAPAAYRALQQHGMGLDWSWDRSARQYTDLLYTPLLNLNAR